MWVVQGWSTCSWTYTDCGHCCCTSCGACCFAHGLNCCFCHFHCSLHKGLVHDLWFSLFCLSYEFPSWDWFSLSCSEYVNVLSESTLMRLHACVCLVGTFHLLMMPCNCIHFEGRKHLCHIFLCEYESDYIYTICSLCACVLCTDGMIIIMCLCKLSD